MTYYGAKQMADSFRTVRKNTILLAEDIPADRYDFIAAPGVKSIAAQLAHIAVSPRWQIGLHGGNVDRVDFQMFGETMARNQAEEQALQGRDQIIAALRTSGEEFASFLEGLSDERLAGLVAFPPPIQPSTKTRFEMLMGVKEHEMHHRGQLMIIQRLLGIVPHLTRQREAMSASARS